MTSLLQLCLIIKKLTTEFYGGRKDYRIMTPANLWFEYSVVKFLLYYVITLNDVIIFIFTTSYRVIIAGV